LWSDESGATLIEYTLLISLVMLAILSLLISVGGWASRMWGNLLAALNQ
jgi:Flp pilus assembly pilin Flp